MIPSCIPRRIDSYPRDGSIVFRTVPGSLDSILRVPVENNAPSVQDMPGSRSAKDVSVAVDSTSQNWRFPHSWPCFFSDTMLSWMSFPRPIGMMLWPRFVLKDGPTKSDRKSFLERGSTMEEVVVVVCI